MDTTPTIVLPATSSNYYAPDGIWTNVANSLTSPSQSNVGSTFKTDDAFAIVVGNGTQLYGMMSLVINKGWVGYTSGSNEAYILFDLGEKMHVKVVTVIGRSGGGYEETTASHFIGLYDKNPLTNSPKNVWLAGSGGNKIYSKGWDHKINT